MIDESVNGQIVGTQYAIGAIYYNGRKQGSTIYGETQGDLMANCKAKIAMIKVDCGDAFIHIYPKDSWEIKVFQS